MKATLFIIENDKDHAQAKGLIEELMGSNDVDRARMAAQARLIEAYERARWPRRTTTLPNLRISADLLISSKRSRGLAA